MATGYEEAIEGQVVTDDGAAEIPFSADALAVLNKSEIEQQVDIAKKYPRNIDRFRKTLDQYACLNPAVATSMFYSLPRAGKQIVGPGVRMAETLLTCWGNSRAGLRIIGERGDVAVAQGLFFDCEANVGIAIEAQRRITDKDGRKFNQDMIVTTGNAAASVGYRNAIIRGVPRAMWWDIYEKSKQVAVGKAESFVQQVMEAVEAFSKQGVTQVNLLNFLNCPSIRDINGDHILLMRTVFKEIANGDKTIEDVFGTPEGDEIEALMEELGWNQTKRRVSRESYKGKQQEHLEYLRGLAKKSAAPAATNGNGAKKEAPAENPTTTTASSETRPVSTPKADAPASSPTNSSTARKAATKTPEAAVIEADDNF